MTRFIFVVAYDPEKEELNIATPDQHKNYDKIRTPGDIGTAVKDFAMEIEKGET